jgi:chaperone required for assembly of F1-ATPase
METPGQFRRFYKQASVREDVGGFSVTLDGRALKTPLKLSFVTPTRALADLCAAEWEKQSDLVNPANMPLTRLVNVALDHTPRARAEMAAHVTKYGETDLLCHRAEHPEKLALRQSAHWDGPLAWACESLGVRLSPVVGVIAANQEAAALSRIKEIAAGQDDFRLTGLAHGAGLTGSAVLALAMLQGAPPAGDALFRAAALDELWSEETWGADDELGARLARLRGELAALEAFFAALAH